MAYEILEILFQTRFWVGLSALVGVSALSAILARRALLYCDARVLPAWNRGLVYWGVERFALPLSRALGVMTFLLLAYPDIFGLNAASVPDLWWVLNAEARRPNHLLNVLFFSSLFVSLLPVLGRLPALVLPIQGIAGAILLFHWLNAAPDLGRPVSIYHWPGVTVTIVLMGVALGTHWMATRAVRVMEDLADSSAQRPRLISFLIGEWTLAVSSLIPVLIYTRFLGRQVIAAPSG